MIKSKHITTIVIVVICLALFGSLFMVYGAEYTTVTEPDYQKKLFNGEVVDIEIEVEEETWNDFLENARSKEYISADLVINGDRFSTVGIRAKGNSSLSQMSGDSDRYSLQLNPDKYVEGQSFYGLDVMCLNNITGDPTYMKDYISYSVMEYLDVPSPLRNYANVTVNGEHYGFCLLLERYDDSFLDRVYNTTAGELYNVKIQMGERTDFEEGNREPPARGEGMAMSADKIEEGTIAGMVAPDGDRAPPEEDMQAPEGGEQQQGRGGGMMGDAFSSGGGSLVYTDDDPASYGSIFNNHVSSKVSDNDQQQVITAIKKLNEGEDLEEYWDVDEILRYLAAHTFVVNLDSYVGTMQQNYYLYEREGKISIFPWDYNYAFGAFQSGDASSVVNFPIDTPVSDGVSMEDRPLVNQLLAVDEYKERYHSYLNDIVEGYVGSGLFEAEVDALDETIQEYVKNDSSAFYTYEEYEASLPALKELVALRAQSIAGQLDGSIPSTREGQEAAPEQLIDASGLDFSALGGGMGGGGFGGGQQRGEGEGGNRPGGGMGNMDMDAIQEMMTTVAEGGELTEEQKQTLVDMGISEEEVERFSQMIQGGGFGGGMMGGGEGGGPGGPGGTDAGTTSQSVMDAFTIYDWIAYGVLFVVLLAAILFVALTNRRKWRKIKAGS